ncbi:hypothetical protein QQF64_028644 [Cirrhinus molitorella]|uniref:Uncharacterized protein n=1 Tax=Cirrhinus molitorella TaxID=172907 RepID=A0ABR3N7J0_9TELE
MRAFCRPLPQTSITTVSQPPRLSVCARVYRGVRSASNAVAAACGFLPVLDFLEGGQPMSHSTNHLIPRLAVLFQFTSPLGCRNVEQRVNLAEMRDMRAGSDAFKRAVVQRSASALLQCCSIAQARLFRDGDWLVCSNPETVSSAGRDLCDIPRCPRRDPSCHVERFLFDSRAGRAFLLVSGATETAARLDLFAMAVGMRELVVEVMEFGIARSLGGSHVSLCGGDSLSIVFN